MKLLVDFERVKREEEERVNLAVRMEQERQDLRLVIERVKGVEEERMVLLAHAAGEGGANRWIGEGEGCVAGVGGKEQGVDVVGEGNMGFFVGGSGFFENEEIVGSTGCFFSLRIAVGAPDT